MIDKNQLYYGIIIGLYTAVLILLFGTGMNWISMSEKGTEDSLLIGASYMTMNNEFYEILNEQIRVRVEGEGDRMVLRDPGLDPERQAEQINSMISMGIRALIVTPVTSNSLSEVLSRARKLGIRIIVVDTELKDPSQADCTIVSDNYRAGHMIGRYMMSKQSSGEILILNHETARSAHSRVKGFKDAILSNSNFRIVKEINCKGQYEIALPLVESFIRSGGEFDTVFSLNDLAGEAAVTVIRIHPELGKVHVYGVDGSPDAKSLILSGDLEATATQYPTEIGKEAANILYQMLNNDPYPSTVTVPVDLVYRENVEEYDINRWQ